MRQHVLETASGHAIITHDLNKPGVTLRVEATTGDPLVELRLTEPERAQLALHLAAFAPSAQEGDGHNPACSPWCKGNHPRPSLMATEVAEGDVFLHPETEQVVYTVERVLHQDEVNGLQVLVRYAADHGTGVRAFDITKRTPLTRPTA